ncbi:hypothetical protein RZS08_39575, partial [Arthrospira platensis SPKY1]|nr:hypothetical protein [Arthrospira platensis SPKY1]
MILNDGQPTFGGIVVTHLDEHQLAAAPALGGDVLDARATLHGVAHAQRLVEFEAAAGPHAARQRHRRQESTAPGVAVVAEVR